MDLLIFDLDGTLIDSKRDIVMSVNRAFMQLGFPTLPEASIGAEIGRGSEYLFRRLLGDDAPNETIQSLVRCFKLIYSHHLLDHTQVYPGVVESLQHYRNIPKVVVTNKNQAFADRLIEELGLSSHFEAIFGPEAFATQKPDPGPILEVCKRWGVRPSETVVIGDSQFDIVAGKAAEARTVGASYGFSRPEIFELNPPDYRIDAADQLIGLFPLASETE